MTGRCALMQNNAMFCILVKITPDLNMDGHKLEETEVEKDVGVHISGDLKPSTQCSKAAGKANCILGMMARTFHYRNKETWLKLYRTYVRPHLEYAIPSWSPWYEQDKKLLEKVQSRAIRMCTNLRGDDYEEKLKNAGLETLEKRRLNYDLTQVWKILHGFDNVDERKWFTRAQDEAVRTTRLTALEWNLTETYSKTEPRRQFFSKRVVKHWNRLPELTKSSEKISIFKRRLKCE